MYLNLKFLKKFILKNKKTSKTKLIVL